MNFENLAVGQMFHFDLGNAQHSKSKYRKVSDNHYCYDYDRKPVDKFFTPYYTKVIVEDTMSLTEAEVVSGPQHQHDSTCCRFLGRRGTVDVYWCSGDGSMLGASMIGRFGSDGPDYASSMPPMSFAYPESYLLGAYGWYHFCLLEGVRLGLLGKDDVGAVAALYHKLNQAHGIRQEQWLELGSDERMSDRKGIV